MIVDLAGLAVTAATQTQRQQFFFAPGARRLEVDAARRREQRHGGLQRLGEQGLVAIVAKRRIEEDEVPAAARRALQGRDRVAALDLDLGRLQAFGIGAQAGCQARVLLAQQHLDGTTRGGLEAQRAAAGEGVEAAQPGQVLTQPVEERLAHAVGRRAQTGPGRHRQLAAFPQPADDANETRRGRDNNRTV